MAQHFYADCVITDIKPIVGQPVANVTAKVDGRQVKRIIISKEMQLYFARVNGKEKSRVWFAVVSFFGKKALLVRALETQAGEKHVEKNKTGHAFYDVVVRPVAGGAVAWFATWVLGIIPMALLGGEAAVGALYMPSIWIGVLAWLYFTFLTIRFLNQLGNTESWPEGDPSRYSTAVKPAFGAGLV